MRLRAVEVSRTLRACLGDAQAVCGAKLLAPQEAWGLLLPGGPVKLPPWEGVGASVDWSDSGILAWPRHAKAIATARFQHDALPKVL